ncbi:DMT family transporter [Pseudooceanicola sediminis]|uniref:DMT family transporter n=1 Tax=Pseudooceanicola sediminis TaxID=2211117 RepID=A0A399IXT1_9RHOB|nr:DMT family transporter [Puniceibacterium sp. HSS470]MCB1469215.1 DMT family transporter [Rhizobiaceae bacterium]RII37257.1 DMT family transporter [Pseudooceanicola sediminis]|tara:strand:- start:36559 stop:37470 length:912 start_codon:yes stop_codon:yes gene_type:complete
MSIVSLFKIVAAMLLWAACYPLITVGIKLAPHLSFATLRAVIAGLALVGLAYLLRRPLPRGAGVWAALCMMGIGATTLGFLGMFHAAEFVSPGIATVIANTQPLLAAGLAGIVLGERLQSVGKAGLFIGFLGIIVIAAPQLFSGGQDSYILGIAYIVLAALGVTVSNVMIKKIAGKTDPLMAMGLQLLIGSVPLAIIAGMTEDPFAIQWCFTFIFVLLALALFGSALVYVLWMSVLTVVPLNQANAFSFLVPIFGLTMGVLFYGEAIGWLKMTGIFLAIIGVVLVTRNGATRDSGEKPLSGSI